MPRYKVKFSVPAEVVVYLDEEDEDTAADVAWELAQQHLQTVSVPSALEVSVHADLDGIGADSVEEA